MPYDNPYNRNIANELAQVNHRYAKLYAYSPVDGSGMTSFPTEKLAEQVGGSSGGVLFQTASASKRDGEDNMYNDEMKLPPQYYYGVDAEPMMGGSGFAEGTFRDTGIGHQDGASSFPAEKLAMRDDASGAYEKGMGMSGGNKDISGMTQDLFGSATPQHFRQLGRMLGQHMKGQGMSGGSVLSDITEGLSDTLGLIPRMLMGGAILGNPDPYPRVGDSERIAGRGKITASERKALQSVLAKHPEMTGAGFWDDFKKGFNMVISPIASVVKAIAPAFGPEGVAASAGISALGYGNGKNLSFPTEKLALRDAEQAFPLGKKRGRPVGSGKKKLVSANGDLLAMPSPVALPNGVPPTAQLRGAYGGAKPSFPTNEGSPFKGKLAPQDSLKDSVIKAVEKKLAKKIKGEQVDSEMKGCGDKRKVRAELVKRIMKEKGMKMVEASSYIKAHNLYKP